MTRAGGLKAANRKWRSRAASRSADIGTSTEWMAAPCLELTRASSPRPWCADPEERFLLQIDFLDLGAEVLASLRAAWAWPQSPPWKAPRRCRSSRWLPVRLLDLADASTAGRRSSRGFLLLKLAWWRPPGDGHACPLVSALSPRQGACTTRSASASWRSSDGRAMAPSMVVRYARPGRPQRVSAPERSAAPSASLRRSGRGRGT